MNLISIGVLWIIHWYCMFHIENSANYVNSTYYIALLLACTSTGNCLWSHSQLIWIYFRNTTQFVHMISDSKRRVNYRWMSSIVRTMIVWLTRDFRFIPMRFGQQSKSDWLLSSSILAIPPSQCRGIREAVVNIHGYAESIHSNIKELSTISFTDDVKYSFY